MQGYRRPPPAPHMEGWLPTFGKSSGEKEQLRADVDRLGQMLASVTQECEARLSQLKAEVEAQVHSYETRMVNAIDHTHAEAMKAIDHTHADAMKAIELTQTETMKAIDHAQADTLKVVDRLEPRVTGANNQCRSLDARVSQLTSELAASADLHTRLNGRIDELYEYFQTLIDILSQDNADVEAKLRALSQRRGGRGPPDDALYPPAPGQPGEYPYRS